MNQLCMRNKKRIIRNLPFKIAQLGKLKRSVTLFGTANNWHSTQDSTELREGAVFVRLIIDLYHLHKVKLQK